MVDVETILDWIPAIGVIIALIYYTQILRNAEKTRQREQIFLRLQSFDLQYNRAIDDLMNNWTGQGDYHSFEPETRLNYNFISARYQSVGVMLRENMIDPDILYQIFSPRAIMSLWEKSEHLVKDNREINNYSTYMDAFEYLYKETKKRYPDILTWGHEDRQ